MLGRAIRCVGARDKIEAWTCCCLSECSFFSSVFFAVQRERELLLFYKGRKYLSVWTVQSFRGIRLRLEISPSLFSLHLTYAQFWYLESRRDIFVFIWSPFFIFARVWEQGSQLCNDSFCAGMWVQSADQGCECEWDECWVEMNF